MILHNILEDKYREEEGAKEESSARSIIKSITWRIIGTADTVLISWLITGTLTIAFSIGAIELFSKMLLYFAHERVWNTIKWGKYYKQ